MAPSPTIESPSPLQPTASASTVRDSDASVVHAVETDAFFAFFTFAVHFFVQSRIFPISYRPDDTEISDFAVHIVSLSRQTPAHGS